MFPYNILLNIKSGITPVKSRDSATLFLFNCRRWDYTNCQNICQTVFQKFPNRILIRTGLGIFAYSQQFDNFCHRIVTKNAFRGSSTLARNKNYYKPQKCGLFYVKFYLFLCCTGLYFLFICDIMRYETQL